jgi:AcrR family transcriptional regulator
MLGTPIRDRRAERRSQTRTEILAAAWETARTQGLAGLRLRDVAARVGMRAPSLYSYFDSKHAIYDAMFAQGWQEYRASAQALPVDDDPLAELRRGMRHFIDFCLVDPVRYQLLCQRTIPGFEPSAESYALAVAAMDALHHRLARIGVTDPAALDLLTAVGAGLVSQQVANEPGGDRWVRLVDRALDMFYAHVTSAPASRPTSDLLTRTAPEGTRHD